MLRWCLSKISKCPWPERRPAHSRSFLSTQTNSPTLHVLPESVLSICPSTCSDPFCNLCLCSQLLMTGGWNTCRYQHTLTACLSLKPSHISADIYTIAIRPQSSSRLRTRDLSADNFCIPKNPVYSCSRHRDVCSRC